MEKLKQIIQIIIRGIQKEQALPVLTWTVIMMIGLALVFSVVWLWPALLIGAIIIVQARKFQLSTYKKIIK